MNIPAMLRNLEQMPPSFCTANLTPQLMDAVPFRQGPGQFLIMHCMSLGARVMVVRRGVERAHIPCLLMVVDERDRVARFYLCSLTPYMGTRFRRVLAARGTVMLNRESVDGRFLTVTF